MKLWLDDMRDAPEDWEWFMSPWEMLDFVLRMGDAVDEWSLDHDLGYNVPTGYDFLCMVELLRSLGLKVHIPKVSLHTSNPVGRDNMNRVLKSMKIDDGDSESSCTLDDCILCEYEHEHRR